MPIHLPLKFRSLSEDEFRKLDYAVMRHAFAAQNELGRFCDEVIYQADLAARLQSAGVTPVRCELPITLSFRGFQKKLFLDMVVVDGAIYELKVVLALVGEHEAQLLTYLFVVGVRHGKLINFRPASVEHRFVNAVISPEEQREFTLATDRWREMDSRCALFRETLTDLLRDWGVFLSLALYEEALTYCLGGEAAVARAVPLSRAGLPLGHHKFLHVSAGVAFRLTAATEDTGFIERDFQRLLNHTPLRAIHWVNLNRHRVELVTLTK